MDLSKLMSLNELARADAARYPKRREAFGRLTAEAGRHFIGRPSAAAKEAMSFGL